MSAVIPYLAIEIGPSLFLVLENITFKPYKKAYTAGLPEDCYPAEPAECDWDNEDASLVLEKGKDEQSFSVDNSFVYAYYDQIIEAIEEI